MSHSPARSTIDVGSVIAGTYTIEALIGRGGMGAVFLASHTRLPGKQVAIKVLHAELGGDEIEARFKREAHIASLLSHPNIVHIEDYNVTADGMPYLVLEYLQGESLAQCIRRAGPMSVDDTLSVLRQVGSALAAAHAKGIVHRDLKPQNIFLVPTELDGKSRVLAKVLDFGISKITGSDSATVKTQDGALLGTPQYMAPEQATGQHDKVDERTDIFALGAIVYEMLSASPAFSGQTIPEVVFKVVYEQPVELATRAPTVPDSIRDAVQRAMSKAQAERYPNVSAFVEALTGSPVSVLRVAAPRASTPASATFDGTGPTSASGQTPVTPAMTDREALAETVGSGDHSAAVAQTAASQPAPASAAPAAAAPASAAPAAAAPASAAPAAADIAVARSRAPADIAVARSRAPAIVGALLLAVTAVGGIAWATHRGRRAGHRARSVDVTAPLIADAAPALAGEPIVAVTAPMPDATTPDSAAVTTAVDAGAGSAVTSAKHATVPKAPTPKPVNPMVVTPKPVNPKPTPAPTGDDDEISASDSYVGAQLAKAREHIAKSEWSAASNALDKAFGAKDARPVQLDQVRSLRGVIACNRNDTEGAKSVLNALVGRPKMRLRVLEACHQNGWFEDIKR